MSSTEALRESSPAALDKLSLTAELQSVLSRAKSVVVPESRQHLLDLVFAGQDEREVAYEVPGMGRVVEAEVVRCRNGASINYTEVYMRRRDPECMVIADEQDTDKVRYHDRFGSDFSPLRAATLEWLSEQEELIVMPFTAGRGDIGYPALLVAPSNAAFFAGGLADLQGFIPAEEVPKSFRPQAVIYLAPPFRHTHFDGKQVVVHNRTNELHELFSYNLYPGPSAKKGVYGVLINIGEIQGWVTLHCSTVKIVTPYENEFVIMHEGASGGGKSEMIQELHREPDGTVLVGENVVSGEQVTIKLSDTCELHPVTDDMALTHPRMQVGHRKLIATDAEEGWFLRVDHIKRYGTVPYLERLAIHPPEPLIFLNLDGRPGGSCLLWEHTMDSPEVPCPNPRVIMPRRFVPGAVEEPLEIDVRSFGVRTPPSTKDQPNYGIIGLFHVLPPALGWLWRLAAPRGHSNPSIVGADGLTSEGVGSYWPFATGKMVRQANLLLDQILETPETRFKLIPNQYVGAYKVGFMPEWLAREYLSRRGSVRFKPDQLVPARSPLLGWALRSLKIDGTYLPKGLLQVDQQLAVGEDAYDKGAVILSDFFKRELHKFNTPDLSLLGRRIIDICLSDGTLEDYVEAIS